VILGAPSTVLPPADLRVSITRGVRVIDDGRLVLGGTPFRKVTLTAEGARAIRDWMSPSRETVGRNPGRRALARRLLDAGILTPWPDASVASDTLTVVVPVRDRPEQLARCLDAVVRTARGSVIVVDDGSIAPVAVDPRLRRDVRVVRNRRSLGPAAARNVGLSGCRTEFVAFVDSDVVLPDGALEQLLAHFADPCVGVVAPRVRGLAPRGLVAGYESRHSPLDMGPTGGLVGPGRRVPYVPSTVLVARRAALGPGFDPSLLTGEDVDLIWRLGLAGWRLRYVADVDVLHEHPQRPAEFIAKRYAYARSIGTLARRHPDALPALWMRPPTAFASMLALAGFTRSSAAVMIALTMRTERGLRAMSIPIHGLSVALSARAVAMTGAALGRAVRRAWSPALMMAAPRSRRARRTLAIAFAAPIVADAVATRDVRAAVTDAPLRLADELIAAAGTWHGCLGARTVLPLLPSLRPPTLPAGRPTP
jgi:mycofactocin system glycosyltransferase